MVKPRGQAESSTHFLIILYLFSQACGPKIDSSLSTLMAPKLITPLFMGALIFKALLGSLLQPSRVFLHMISRSSSS